MKFFFESCTNDSERNNNFSFWGLVFKNKFEKLLIDLIFF